MLKENYKSFNIGNIKIAVPLILAPMSGVTNKVFRKLILDENPDALGLTVTEFISIEGLTRGNKQSFRMMERNENEKPFSIQIFGHDIQRMCESAKMVEDAGADIVDINSGCPVPKVVRRGGGCELMRQPEHMKKMLEAVSKSVSIPLTLKIRSGWDDSSKNAMEIAKIAEGSGVKMLAIHGRTRKSLYRGEADWDIVEEIASKISIPVVGSGDVLDYEGADLRLKGSISGLMIGRGALSNPWIFSEIHSKFSGIDYKKPSDLDTVRILRKYIPMLVEEMPEKAVLGRLKQLASQVTRRVRGSAKARKMLCVSKSIEEFLEKLNLWEEYLSCPNRTYDIEFLNENIGQSEPLNIY